MSRRKHKARKTTAPRPTPATPTPPAPENRAAEAAQDEVVYHESLPIRNRHAGGVDLGLRTHWAAAPPLPDGTPQVAEFDTYTDGLEAIADWLQQHGVTTVALEATGVYWEPLCAILEERGFAVILVAPLYTTGIKGRPKTDRLDCQWIQRLHAHGLLPASFRPSADVAVLRHYLRQRAELVRQGARHIQHMQKALEQMNVKLPEVVTDVTGLTGMQIIKAILRGERDPLKLAKYRHERCKRTEAEIARALYGNWREEHLFALKQAVELYEFHQTKLRECDQQLEVQLQTFADKSAGQTLKPRKQARVANKPRFDVRKSLLRMSGVDVTVLEGVDESTALVLLSETGTDMSKWPTEKHFTGWLGLCPQHRGSAGKIKNRRIRRGANRAARAFRMAAQGSHHAKNALGAFYRRIQARSGGGKALIATARKIACRYYRLLKYGQEYVRQDMAAYEELYRLRLIKGLARKATELGYELVATTKT
jgi:transposase